MTLTRFTSLRVLLVATAVIGVHRVAWGQADTGSAHAEVSLMTRRASIEGVGLKSLGGLGGAAMGVAVGGIAATFMTSCATTSEDCTGVKISALAVGTVGLSLGIAWVSRKLGDPPRTASTILGALVGLGIGLLTNAGDPGFEPSSTVHGVIGLGVLPLVGAIVGNTFF